MSAGRRVGQGRTITKNFTVSRTHYRFIVFPGYEIAFELVYGMLRNGKIAGGIDEWGHEESGTQLFDGIRNPVGVTKAVFRLLRQYVNEHKPPFFFFTAYEERRKEVYSRMAKRIEKLTGYRYTGDNKLNELFSIYTFYRPQDFISKEDNDVRKAEGTATRGRLPREVHPHRT